MSAESIVTLIAAILGSSVITAFLTLWFTRPKVTAETKKISAETVSEEVDSTSKTSDLLEKMRGDTVDLYKKNIELEKTNTDLTRTIEILTARLDARDGQLAAATKQLELLRGLAEQTPITDTLRKQLDAMNEIVIKLQAAQSEGQKIMLEKDKAMQELLITNRDLELKKPPRS